jgi:glycerol uptake facilitator-like aquaporin
MRAVLIIFATFATVPFLIALMAAFATMVNGPSSTDALLPLPVFLLVAAAVSALIMTSGVVVSLALRALDRRQR